MSNKKQLYVWLREDGFSHGAASGILGNLDIETGGTYDPESNQDGGPGMGIAQWSEGARWDDLLGWAKARKMDPMKLRTQYEFMVHEMKKGGLGNFNLEKFKKMKNARQAADYFDANFEGSWSQDDEARRDSARATKRGMRGTDVPEQTGTGITGADLVKIARKGLDVPYVGGLGPNASPRTGWDCASFMGWVLRKAGFDNPPTFSETFISKYPKVKGWRGNGPGGVNLKNLQPGDIIVYRRQGTDGSGANGHVGMYIGGKRIIEAASRDKGTQIGSIWYSGSKPIVAVVRPAKDSGVTFDKSNGPSRYGATTEEYYAEQFGITDDFLNMRDKNGNRVNQELFDIIKRADKGDWSDEKFRNEVRNSEWYQSRNEAMRKFDMMGRTDREDILAKTMIGLDALASQMGVDLTDKQRRNIAFRKARNGLDDNMVALILARKYRPQPTESGAVADFQKAVSEKAGEYGYKISASQMEQWTRDHIAGHSTADSYEDEMREWAKRRPNAEFLDVEGKTLRQSLSQYVNSAAQELGVDADNIDLSDDKWMDVWNADENRFKSSAEWKRHIRSDSRYGWENSEMGAFVARNMATSLASAFGRV